MKLTVSMRGNNGLFFFFGKRAMKGKLYNFPHQLYPRVQGSSIGLALNFILKVCLKMTQIQIGKCSLHAPSFQCLLKYHSISCKERGVNFSQIS